MQSKSPLKGFLYFTLLNLAPIIICNAFFFSYAIVTNAVFAFKRNAYQGLFYSLSRGLGYYVFSWITQGIVLVGAMGICYWLFKICKRWFTRGVILYLFWAIIVLAAAYGIIAMFTGVSMAYVDADAQGKHRMEIEAYVETAVVFLIAHIYIIPWVLFCVKRLKRAMNDVFDGSP